MCVRKQTYWRILELLGRVECAYTLSVIMKIKPTSLVVWFFTMFSCL